MEAKKRKRTSYSCTLCRSRKIKCDRSKPVCGRCIRGKCAERCVYDSAPLWSEAGGVARSYVEASEVPFGLVKPIPAGERPLTKHVFEERSGDRPGVIPQTQPQPPAAKDVSHLDLVHEGRLGATTWLALAYKDPFLHHMLDDHKLHKQTEKLKDAIAGRRPRRPVIGPGSMILERQIDFKKEVAPTNVSGDVGSIAAAILQVMPAKDIVDRLLEHFFRFVAPFFPVLDEQSFVESIHSTLSYQADGSLAVLMEKKADVVGVGILLIVLRMAYLNIYLKAQTHAALTATENMILNHPVEANVISTVQLIMEYARYLRKPGLEMLQLLVLLRQYFKYAPEDGDGGDGSDSTVLMGLVVSCAFATGTNREPGAGCPGKLALLWRKVWWYVTMMDIDEGITVGVLPKTHDDEYNTQMPEFSSSDANLADLRLEEETIFAMRRRISLHPALRRALKVAFGVQSEPSVSSVSHEIGSIDALLANASSPDPPDNAMRTADTKALSMEVGRFLLALEHHLLLHSEKTGDERGFYDMTTRVLRRTLGLLQLIMDVFRRLFAELKEYNLTLTQICLTSLVRVSQFFVFALARIRLLELQASAGEPAASPECRALLVELSKRLYSRLNVLNGVLYLVSDTYYGGFKAYSYVSFMLECLKSNLYFAQRAWPAHPNGFGWLAADQLQSMVSLVDAVVIDDPRQFARQSFATHTQTPRSPEPWDSDPGILEMLGAFKEDFQAPRF